MRRKRRSHSPEFKSKVALAAIKGDLTMVELVKKLDVHANQITEWKKQLLNGAPDVFGKDARKAEEELGLMVLIDRCHLEHPYYGSRRIRDWLEDEGRCVNRKRVQRLMRTMGLAVLYPKRNLSLANQAHKVYPYLLRWLTIERPNQVWATDVTYIPMAVGFVYMVAIIDWYSRRVLSWRVSNTLDTSFCIEALNEAIETYGAPEIFNTDQGSQFTSEDFTGVLKQHDIRISMDGMDAVSITSLSSACGAA